MFGRLAFLTKRGKDAFIIGVFSFLLMTSNVSAAEKQMPRPVQAHLTYQVYAGGVHVLESRLDLTISDDFYRAFLSSYTKGFLGRLVPWKGSFESVGGPRPGGVFQVRRHKSISTWKGSDDTAVYTYKKDGSFNTLELTEDGVKKPSDKIDPNLTKDTTDVLAATLMMMYKMDIAGKCKNEHAIFDSRRRFKLQFHDGEDENLARSRYNIYSGTAHRCVVEVVPDGGAWHKKPRGWLSIQEQGRKKGTLPTLWIARVDNKLPPVPVRIMIKTNYGTLMMHLTDVDVQK